MINNYYERIEFLTHFITDAKSKKISYQNLRDNIKEIPPQILDIYNKIIEINDEDLFSFLKDASIPLLKIDKIENYLRAVDSKNVDITKSTKIKGYESIN